MVQVHSRNWDDTVKELIWDCCYLLVEIVLSNMRLHLIISFLILYVNVSKVFNQNWMFWWMISTCTIIVAILMILKIKSSEDLNTGHFSSNTLRKMHHGQNRLHSIGFISILGCTAVISFSPTSSTIKVKCLQHLALSSAIKSHNFSVLNTLPPNLEDTQHWNEPCFHFQM